MLTIRSITLRLAERLSSGDPHAGHESDQNASARRYFMSLYYRASRGIDYDLL
jgi:hypothetical protein